MAKAIEAVNKPPFVGDGYAGPPDKPVTQGHTSGPEQLPKKASKKLLSPELDAMNRIDRILSKIDDKQVRMRVVRWAWEKHGYAIIGEEQCSSQQNGQQPSA